MERCEIDLSELYPEPEDPIEEALFQKQYHIPFRDAYGRRQVWDIDTPLEVKLILEAILQDVSDHELAVWICCPVEVTRKVRRLVKMDRDRAAKEFGFEPY